MANKKRPNSLRLADYDYAQAGAYFITTVIKGRKNLLSKIVAGSVQLSALGQAVQEVWQGLPEHYQNLRLDDFIVMPDHIHGILFLRKDPNNLQRTVGAGLRPAPTPERVTAPIPQANLPEIVRALKSFSSRRINELRASPGETVWQRGYYDRVIRSEAELNEIRDYIRTNPLRWTLRLEGKT